MFINCNSHQLHLSITFVKIMGVKCYIKAELLLCFLKIFFLSTQTINLTYLPTCLCITRYDESTNELINEELGIAYPIIDGMPNMIPQAARLMGKGKQEKESE